MSGDNSATTEPPEQKQSFLTRRLNSFGSPNLEVLIGPKQTIYRYHALILASYSVYVDTILSSPMTVDKRSRIEFADIDEDTWETMILHLEPKSRNQNVRLEELERILPFYDKYQFVDGVSLCDSVLSSNLQTKNYRSMSYDIFTPEKLVPIVVMAYNLDLELSKKHAIAWAREVLTKMTVREEDTITKLLPLVENDDQVLLSLIKTIRGRYYMDMTIDEMRQVTKSDTFAREILLKTKQIKDAEELLQHLHVNDIRVRGSPRIAGTYERAGDQWPDAGLPYRGAMIYSYYKVHRPLFGAMDEPSETISLDAMDPLGLVWEISSMPVDEEGQGEDGENTTGEEEGGGQQRERLVLFRWDCGHSSLVPPKHGWQSVEGENQNIDISYAVGRDTY